MNVPLSPNRIKVIEFLSANPGAHSVSEIGRALCLPPNRVNGTCIELSMYGQIERIGINTATRYAAATPYPSLPVPRRMPALPPGAGTVCRRRENSQCA